MPGRLRTVRFPHRSSGRELGWANHATRRSVRLLRERVHPWACVSSSSVSVSRSAVFIDSNDSFVSAALICMGCPLDSPWVGVATTGPLLILKRANTQGLVRERTGFIIKSTCKLGRTIHSERDRSRGMFNSTVTTRIPR